MTKSQIGAVNWLTTNLNVWRECECRRTIVTKPKEIAHEKKISFEKPDDLQSSKLNISKASQRQCTLTFEVAPYVFDYLEHGERLEVCSVCLVVVPLVALMKDQVTSLVARGISAASVGADCTREQVKEISEGKYSLVFGSPEALLNSHRSIFHGKLRKNLKAVFVDESHCMKYALTGQTRLISS